MAKNDDSGMGVIGVILGLGFLGLLAKASSDAEEKAERERKQRENEEKRKSTPCFFNDGLSEAEFSAIVQKAGKKIKRVSSLTSDGPVVYGTFESNSGLSDWSFDIDFNDYGHITGTYWLSTDNSDSIIPERIANIISDAIKATNPCTESNHSYEDKNKNDSDESNIENVEEQNKRVYSTNDRKKYMKIRAIFILAAVLFLLFGIGIYEFKKMIPIGYSRDSLIGLEYSKVVENLNDAGFINVQTEEISNLKITEMQQENLTTDVRLIYKDDFDEETKYPSNLWVTVVYHTVEQHQVPLSSKEAKRMNYADVVRKFEEAGFINISTNIQYDIITGWITDDGEVESVTINGEQFESNEKFRPDANIIITYHTYKKNRSQL